MVLERVKKSALGFSNWACGFCHLAQDKVLSVTRGLPRVGEGGGAWKMFGVQLVREGAAQGLQAFGSPSGVLADGKYCLDHRWKPKLFGGASRAEGSMNRMMPLGWGSQGRAGLGRSAASQTPGVSLLLQSCKILGNFHCLETV